MSSLQCRVECRLTALKRREPRLAGLRFVVHARCLLKKFKLRSIGNSLLVTTFELAIALAVAVFGLN